MSIGWMVALWLATGPHAPAVTPRAPQSAAAAATARALAKAAETATRLAAPPHPEPDGSGLDDWRIVDSLQPEPLEAELDRTLHQQVGDFVEAWLSEHGAAAPADELRDELELALWWGPEDDEGERLVPCALDGEVRLTVVRPADDPGLLAVSWRTQLSFLGNASLYVFTTGGGRVQRVLEWSAELAGWPEGESTGTLPLPFGPTDVLHDFDFRLTARDEWGDFYVAAAWSEPSPASSWGAVSWALLASSLHPSSPRVLARGSDGAWQCFDDCYDLGLEGDLVILDYTGFPGALAVCSGFTSVDLQQVWRLVDGEAEELSLSSREPFHFVSDWIDASWSDARLWSPRGWGMQRWHRLLREVACQLERGRQWVDACEAPRREVLELVLVTTGESDAEEQRLSLFFLFEADADTDQTLQLLDITPEMPAGDWQDLDGCEGVPGESSDES